jgi:hypothetical protein
MTSTLPNLTMNSPCRDTANPALVLPITEDHEGEQRIFDPPGPATGLLDRGADEWSGGLFVRGDTAPNGMVDQTDYNTLRMFLCCGGLLACQDAGDVNDDGVVNMADLAYLSIFVAGNGAPPLAPYPSCGKDPSADALPYCLTDCP